MTYLDVHLRFLLAPTVVVAFLAIPRMAAWGLRGRLAVPAMAVVAFLYTTPWDNFLIVSGVWDSPEDRIIGRLWYVPIEEYLFFVVQPLLTGYWTGLWASRERWQAIAANADVVADRVVRRSGMILFGALSVLGAVMLLRESTFYMGAIFAWCGPVLLGMWAYAGPDLWRLRGTLLLGILVPTLYLWVADRTAIAEGVWVISETHTVGWAPFGLPVEEALFFLVTNVLVVLGVALVLAPDLDDHDGSAWRGGDSAP